MNETITLSDKTRFELFIGKRRLLGELFERSSGIPLFSANPRVPFGLVDKSNVKAFTHDCVLWGIDGDFVLAVVKAGTPFATTDHCGAIRILDHRILPELVVARIESQAHRLGFDRGLRASLTNMSAVQISLPVGEDGSPDSSAQAEIAKRHVAVQAVKMRALDEAEQLRRISVELPRSGDFDSIALEDLFDFAQTTNKSALTRRFVNEHPGPIPVYSASGDPIEAGYGRMADNLPGIKYFEDSLTWNIDGSLFRAFYRTGRFSLSEKVIPLVLFKKWRSLINLHYVKYLIDLRVAQSGAAYQNKPGKGRIRTLRIEVPMRTVRGKRVPDEAAQRELAAKYASLADAQQRVVAALRGIAAPSVDL